MYHQETYLAGIGERSYLAGAEFFSHQISWKKMTRTRISYVLVHMHDHPAATTVSKQTGCMYIYRLDRYPTSFMNTGYMFVFPDIVFKDSELVIVD